MTLPNFLIVGAPKCGTTSVYQYLRQHPDVFMPDNKEPMFFAYRNGIPSYALTRNVVTNLASYEALFAPVTAERAVGEASSIYLYWPEALHGIQSIVPDAKLIAIVRDPVERAYSNFMHQRRVGHEASDDFGAALRAEPRYIAENRAPFWHYVAVGRYHAQIERFYRAFGRDRVRVYLYDELRADPVLMLRDMFRFLGVDDTFVPDVTRRYTTGGRARVRAIRNFVRSPNRLKDAVRPWVPDRLRRFLVSHEAQWNRTYPRLDARLRERLVREYREDNLKLAALLDRDLSSWLDPNPR